MLLNVIVYCVITVLMMALGAGASLQDAAAGNYLAVFGGIGLIFVVYALAVLIAGSGVLGPLEGLTPERYPDGVPDHLTLG